MIIPNRVVPLLLVAALACSQPGIEAAGGKNGKPGGGGGDGDGGNNGGAGKSGGGGNGAPPVVNYGDGGIPDAASSGADPIGEGPACATDTFEAKLAPVDLLLLLDISGSMEESAGTQSKWTAMRDALATFVKDPMSAGLGVGMETFPPPSKKCAGNGDCGAGYCEEKGVCNVPQFVATTEPGCNDNGVECTNLMPCTKYGICAKSGLRCTGATCGMGEACSPRPKFCVVANAGCDATAYQTPIVGVADLPGAVPMLETAMAGIVPQGTTPTTPAVTGALTYLRGRATAHPERKQVLVLATDGMPTECGFTNSVADAAMALQTAQMGMPGIVTYVIGIFGSNQITRAQPNLEQLATAGGTMTPFTLMTGNDLNQRFLGAINQIRGATLGCEFAIPKPAMGMLDFDKLNVRVRTGPGPTEFEDLGYVDGAAKCDPMRGGWYFDVDPKTGTPTRVLLCEASCTKVKKAAKVELRVGCKRIVIQ